MNVLLLSGAKKIGSQPIVEVVRELDAQGVTVRLAMFGAAADELLEVVPDAVVWGPVRRYVSPIPEHVITGSTDGTDFATSVESEVDETSPTMSPAAAATPSAPRRPVSGFGPDRVRAALAWRMLRLRKAVRPYWGPLRARVARVARVVRRTRTVGVPRHTWKLIRRDQTVLAWFEECDVLVAMDSQSILAAWRLAKGNARPEVVYGLSAGRGLISRRLAATSTGRALTG